MGRKCSWGWMERHPGKTEKHWCSAPLPAPTSPLLKQKRNAAAWWGYCWNSIGVHRSTQKEWDCSTERGRKWVTAYVGLGCSREARTPVEERRLSRAVVQQSWPVKCCTLHTDFCFSFLHSLLIPAACKLWKLLSQTAGCPDLHLLVFGP